MESIVIAEKDSQARLYRDTVGGRYGPVLAASGHLFALAEPEDVNPAWKDWSVGILRPEGGFYPNRISGGSSAKRYSAIKDAARQVDTIYIATDPDREGEGIGMNIVNALRRDIGWQGRVLRVIQNANDEKTLKAAFAEAKPVEHFKSLYQSFVARQQADQIYNLSLTRTATVLFRPNGWKGALSIGRVLTPTFGLVCRREREIADFRARDYFHPWIEVMGTAGRVRLTHAPAEKDRLFERAEADRIMRLAETYQGPIRVHKQQKTQAPPPLFSMSKLQVEAARRFKWPVKKTTDVLQAIYESGAVTYPRSSETTLPEAEIENAPAMLEGILRVPGIGPVAWSGAGPVIRVKAGAFSDKALKGAAHTAIVPNVATVRNWLSLFEAMSADQRKLFELIARRYLSAIGPDRIYDSTRQWIEADKRQFAVSGTVEIAPGWREAMGAARNDPDPEEERDDEDGTGALPPFSDNDPVKAIEAGVAAKQTVPPPRYTDASLVLAMIEAWRHVQDQEVRAILKETEGIGTEATRSSIVENLLKRGLVAPEKKGGALKATEAGMQFFGIIEKAAPRLLDVGLTGQMELLLERIKSGDAKAVAVVNEIVGVAETALESMVAAKSGGAAITAVQSREPSEAMKKAARAKAQREGIKVPAGALTDMEKCRAFLGPMRERPADGKPLGPSDSAKGFAMKIAADLGTEVPAEALADAKALSAWIDKHKTKGGSTRKTARPEEGGAQRSATKRPPDNNGGSAPSSKQVGFAEKIAARKRIEIPQECFRDKGLMSRWIDSHTG